MTDYFYKESGTNHLTTPDSAALDIAGDIDLRAEVALNDWAAGTSQYFVCRWEDGQRSYGIVMVGSSVLRIFWTENGTDQFTADATVGLGVTDGERKWVRATLDVDNGASGHDATFYTSDDGVIWIQLGAVVTTAGTTSIHTGTSELVLTRLRVTTGNFDGALYHAQVLDGIGGTVIFDADLTDLTAAELEAGTFIEDSSEAATVTITGDAWTYARIYTVHDILRETEALYMAGDGNKFHSPKWADRSGNNHHAQNGSAAGADANDALGKAHDGFQYLHIPPVDGNYLIEPSPPASADIAAEEVATIAIWFRTSAFRDFDRIFSTRQADEGVMLSLGAAAASDFGGTYADSVGAVGGDEAHGFSADVWNYLVVTIDHTGAVDLATPYFNGTAGTGIDISSLGTIAASAAGMVIGAETNGNNPFRGDIATVEFYKTLATPSQITTAHAGGVGTQLPLGSPVAVVDMNDLTEPYATFTDPQSNVWTFTRSATGLVLTVIDQDQWLHSTDDYHDIPDAPGLDFAADESLTLMAVMRTHDVTPTSFGRIVGKGVNGATPTPGYALDLLDSGSIVQGSIDTGAIGDNVAVSDGTLHTVVLVCDVTDDEIEAFVDAVGSGSPTPDTSTGTLANSVAFSIGARVDASTDAFYEGSIIAVALWRRALTDAEILDAHQLLTGQGLVKDNYLHLPGVSGEYASAPDIAAYNLNDTFFLAAFVALDDWTPTGSDALIGQFTSGGNERAYVLKISATGAVQLQGSDDGTTNETVTSSVTVDLADGVAHWIGCNFDGGVVEFFKGGSDITAPNWVELGTDQTFATITTVHNSTGTFTVGGFNDGTTSLLNGNIYRALAYSDLARTTPVFDADFTKLTAADLEAGNFLEDSSNQAVVTLNGDEWAYTRPYPHDDLLATAELLLQAHDENKFFSPKWADRSRRNHHAQNGSAAGADANDALGKAFDGLQYAFMPKTGSANKLSTPDAAVLDPTDGIDLRIRVRLSDVAGTTQHLITKDDFATNRSYYWRLQSTSQVLLVSYGVSINSTVNLSTVVSDGDLVWLRVACDYDNGTSNSETDFYYSFDTTNDPDAVTWTQLGSTVLAAVITASDLNQVLEVSGSGNNLDNADVYRAVVYDDIDGIKIFDAVLEDAASPYATFTERSANAATVTINRSTTGRVSTIIDRDQWLYSTDDNHEVADRPALDFGLNDSFTLMVVARGVTPIASNESLIDKNNAGGQAGYNINLRVSDGAIRGSIRDASDNTSLDEVTEPDSLTLYSAAFVRDVVADDVEAFKDGIGSGTPQGDFSVTSNESTDPLRIGRASGGVGSTFYEGAIMAVAIWRRALTDAEVLEAHGLLIRQVQYLRPDSDVTVGGWTPTPTTPTTLFDKVDEVVPVDADFITEA